MTRFAAPLPASTDGVGTPPRGDRIEAVGSVASTLS